MSTIQTLREGATDHPEEIANFIPNSCVVPPGGVFSRNGGGLQVVAQSPATMFVEISEGNGVAALSTEEMKFPIRVWDGNYAVQVTSNSSGNPRKDVVVIYIDTTATANSTATNVAKAAVVAGSPGASPIAPGDAAIQTAIGGNYPYIILAEVDVADGATSITNSEITDVRGKVLTGLDRLADGSAESKYLITYSISSDNLIIEIKDENEKSFSSSNVGYFRVGGSNLIVNEPLTLTLEDSDTYNPFLSSAAPDGDDFELFIYLVNNNSSIELAASLSPVESYISTPYVDDSGKTNGSLDMARIIMSGTFNSNNSIKNIGSLKVNFSNAYDWSAPSSDKIVNEPVFSSGIYHYDLIVKSVTLGTNEPGTVTTEDGYFKVEGGTVHFSIDISGNAGSPLGQVLPAFFIPIPMDTDMTLRMPAQVYDNGTATPETNSGMIENDSATGAEKTKLQVSPTWASNTGFTKSAAFAIKASGSYPFKSRN
jgi:hypothetical protein